jgi:hypothetical protein
VQMTRSLRGPLMAIGLALAASAAPAQEVDLAGSWRMTILGKSPLGVKEATLTFEQSGFNLVVTIQGKSGATRSIGYIDGNHLRFDYVTAGKRADVVSKFSGHVRGDLMGGELDLGKQGITTWKATRGAEQEVDLSGTWTLQMRGESPSGLHLVKMTFRQADHRLVVTLHGEKSDVDCEGYVEGRIITFYYVRHTDREEFVAKFTGQLGGARMGGEVDMGELGKTTWRATQDI